MPASSYRAPEGEYGGDLLDKSWPQWITRMTDSDDPEEFDSAARDRIRRKIQHYMVEHRIGVHRLADRITAANRHRPEIPIKTLQRFLAGKHRTNDMYVRFFHQFAENLPDHDPLFELGRSLAAAYGAAESPQMKALRRVLPARYEVLFDQDTRYSEVTTSSEGRFQRLHEVVAGDGRQVYDGVMVDTGSAELAVMKDRLLGLPKTYMLRVAVRGLSGQGILTDISGNQSIHQIRFVGKDDER